MASDCMTASGTGSLIFIDDVTHDFGSRMYSEAYRNCLSVNLQRIAHSEDLYHAARQRPKTHSMSSSGERGSF